MTLRARHVGPGARGVVALAVALLLAGCGLGAGETPRDVALRVTDDFGGGAISDSGHPRLEGEDTVMRLLRRNARVQTAYDGAFVTAIDGRDGGERTDGRRRDWLFFVDGVQAAKGATATRVRDGDRVWWDRQDTALAPVGAVVGSFPAPFHRVADGADVRCADPSGPACRTTIERLRAVGVSARARTLADRSPVVGVRVLVGPWRSLRAVEAAEPFARGPRVSGVLAVPVRGGVAVYDSSGRSGPLVRRWGLVAAMRRRGSGVTWLVTGSTEADAASAAAALRETTLRGRFAVLVRGAQVDPVPSGPRR
ncbi:DUF4430 domain-containing protein [Patulibacter sp.]|uniref:DUF4430 domain-containing protein n=1 Tax=Patulibacter sp. TaxID=1912859 RepID=UPI002727DD70|nr:DUF4430 domain-containing protein [Patulibacter sp.]MDO9409035.1 DUF4430 domain-containing protein [Patulibacter sp.]